MEGSAGMEARRRKGLLGMEGRLGSSCMNRGNG